MTSLAELLTPSRLQALATPANLRLGTQIRDEGGVTRGEFGPLRVTATVGGTASAETRRKVELTSSEGGGTRVVVHLHKERPLLQALRRGRPGHVGAIPGAGRLTKVMGSFVPQPACPARRLAGGLA